MKCPNREIINAYNDKELINSEKKALELHLETCKECASYLFELRKISLLIGSIEENSVSDSFTESVMNKIEPVSISSWSHFISFMKTAIQSPLSYSFIILAIIINIFFLTSPFDKRNFSDRSDSVVSELYQNQTIFSYEHDLCMGTSLDKGGHQ